MDKKYDLSKYHFKKKISVIDRPRIKIYLKIDASVLFWLEESALKNGVTWQSHLMSQLYSNMKKSEYITPRF